MLVYGLSIKYVQKELCYPCHKFQLSHLTGLRKISDTSFIFMFTSRTVGFANVSNIYNVHACVLSISFNCTIWDSYLFCYLFLSHFWINFFISITLHLNDTFCLHNRSIEFESKFCDLVAESIVKLGKEIIFWKN